VGSLKASYTFLLSLPLRTHELSSPRCLETRIKPDVGSAGFAAEAGKQAWCGACRRGSQRSLLESIVCFGSEFNFNSPFS